MPRKPQHALTWSGDDGLYTLSSQGRVERSFRPGDEAAWQGWLGGVITFAFRGAAGGLNVCHEARPRGGHYWYAYRTGQGRTRKRYLGATARVSLARLEEVAAALAAEEGAAPPPSIPAARAADAVAALPATKLAPPQPPSAPVGRAGLLAALDAALATPLTLVSAPAGWGKTTALAAWARRHPRRVAWLALEAADDAPARFWSAAIAALRARIPGVGATALALLRAPQPPAPTAIVTALLNELAGVGAEGAPLLFVLDDYQAIADPAIHESLAFLLDHLPAGLRLIVASRVDPPLPLARLRARGQLAELRAADLRFSSEETDTFLRLTLGTPLVAGEVAMLATRTEGWAAGVQLAALALRGQPDRAAWLAGFTGGHRYLLDYVEEEILARQPPATRRFLLQVAVLPRLAADLCAAVTGDEASRDILATLERDNLFVVPLDEERRWYRLHDLFREALLARAHATEPGLVPEAHRRAASWHAAHGDAREAITHALTGEDHMLAAALIAREAPSLWLGGEAGAVLGWLEALPDAILWRHARLALDAARRLVESLHLAADAPFTQAQVRVEGLLARVEGGLRTPRCPSLPAVETAMIRRRLGLLRALIASRALIRHGDAAGLARLAGEIAGPAEGEEVRWQLIGLALRFWLTCSIRREGVGLLPQLHGAKRRALDAGEHLAAIRAMVWLACACGLAGRPREVERECLAGLALAERLDVHTASLGYLHLYLAEVYYTEDRLAEAADTLRAVLRVARTWQQADLLIRGNVYLSRVALAGGDPAAADRMLREAEESVRRERITAYEPDIAAMRARHWLATGELARAAAWAAGVTLDPQTLTPLQHNAALARVRVSLAQREYPEALAALACCGARLDRPDAVATTVEYLALRLVALHHAGERQAARAVAARLLALTGSESWLRVYLDEGVPMAEALAGLLDAPGGAPPGAPALPRAHIARLLAAFGGAGQGMPATLAARTPRDAPASPDPIEALTRREREVLRHIADGASNQEIAAALSVSRNTVKKHVGTLLGKLGATSRTRAVARARETALL